MIPRGILDYHLPDGDLSIGQFSNKNETATILLSPLGSPDYARLSEYGINNQYDLRKKYIYGKIHESVMRDDVVKTEDISAKDWHGFLLKTGNSDNPGRYGYSYNVFNYNNDKFINITFDISNDSLSEQEIKDIMASFYFL